MNQLKRVLGLPLLTFYGTGMILGAGIYSLIGKAAGQAGDSLWISFLLAALAALLTAFSYAELGTMFPRAGAEYIYIRKTFPRARWAAISIGLLMAFSGAVTSATLALAFSGYLANFTTFPSLFSAGILLVLLTLVNVSGIKQSSLVNVIFTLIEVSGLLIFIYIGSQSPEFGRALSAQPSIETVSASAIIIFAYFGFENIVTLAEESKNPEKDISRAIFLSIGITTLLYVLVSLSALGLLSPHELAESQAALADATQKYSPKVAGILGAIALFATANTAMIGMITSSRILYGMSNDESLPIFFSKVSFKNKAPWVAALFVLAVSLLLIPIGRVEIVAGVSSFLTMICFLTVNLTLIYLRITQPGLKRPFKIFFSFRKIPIMPVIASLLCLLFLFQFNKQIYYISAIISALCLAAGFFIHARKSNN